MFHLVADDPSQKQTALTIAENLTQDGSVGTSDIAVVVQADGIEPLTAGGTRGPVLLSTSLIVVTRST